MDSILSTITEALEDKEHPYIRLDNTAEFSRCVTLTEKDGRLYMYLAPIIRFSEEDDEIAHHTSCSIDDAESMDRIAGIAAMWISLSRCDVFSMRHASLFFPTLISLLTKDRVTYEELSTTEDIVIVQFGDYLKLEIAADGTDIHYLHPIFHTRIKEKQLWPEEIILDSVKWIDTFYGN